MQLGDLGERSALYNVLWTEKLLGTLIDHKVYLYVFVMIL